MQRTEPRERRVVLLCTRAFATSHGAVATRLRASFCVQAAVSEEREFRFRDAPRALSRMAGFLGVERFWARRDPRLRLLRGPPEVCRVASGSGVAVVCGGFQISSMIRKTGASALA